MYVWADSGLSATGNATPPGRDSPLADSAESVGLGESESDCHSLAGWQAGRFYRDLPVPLAVDCQ